MLLWETSFPQDLSKSLPIAERFSTGGGGGESTEVYSPALTTDPARQTLPPCCRSLWLAVGEGCLNLSEVAEGSPERHLPSPTLGFTFLSDSRENPKCILSPYSLFQTPYLRSNCPAKAPTLYVPSTGLAELVCFWVIRQDFSGGGVLVALSSR